MKYKNYIALLLFFMGALILNYWTRDMLKEGEDLVRIVGQIGINVPLICIFFSNKFYELKEKSQSSPVATGQDEKIGGKE